MIHYRVLNKFAQSLAPAIACLGMSGAVQAGGVASFHYAVDASTELNIPGASLSGDGDGFAVRLSADMTERTFVYGEYFTRRYDELPANFNNYKLGIGAGILDLPIYVALGAERVDIDTGSDANGGSLRFGGRVFPLPMISLNSELAYLLMEDIQGFEGNFGAAYHLSVPLAVSTEFRYTLLDDDESGLRQHFRDFLIGIRYEF